MKNEPFLPKRSTTMTRRLAAFALAGIAFACAKESSYSAAEAPTAATVESARRFAATAADTAPRPGRASLPRIIVRNAELRVVVEDPLATLQAVASFVEAHDGFLADSKHWQERDQPRVSMTLRVPATALGDVLRELKSHAIRIESENITAQDVTEEFSDLSAQITNLEATEKELRGLLATVRERTQKASEVLEVFAELSKVRNDIDRARARVALMQQKAELSTVEVELIPDALSQPIVGPGWRPVEIVRGAGRALVGTLKRIAEMVIWGAVYLLPLALLFALGVALAHRVIRFVIARTRRGD